MKLMSIIRSKPGSYVVLNSCRYPTKPSGANTGSQRRTPSVTPNRVEERETSSGTNGQVHWILHWDMSLTPREKALVQETLILRIVVSGMTFGDYLLLSELRFQFKESSGDYHQRRLITYSDILLDQSKSYELRKMMIEDLYWSEGKDYRRIYGNLKKHWIPERFISFEDIPLETYIDLPRRGEPYSSYCKGYGEGSSRGLIVTPPSAELDGEQLDYVSLDMKIFRLLSNLLAIVFKAERIRWAASYHLRYWYQREAQQ